MEVCADSVLSAINGQKGGASRIELCANLLEGGTTPSIGMLQIVKREVTIPVFVMIRPRGGDFCYNEIEIAVMKEDIQMLKKSGADGFVFGMLNKDGFVDVDACKQLLVEAQPLSVTFHRAIDMSKDIHHSLSQIVTLGFQRVLTSGGFPTALEGRHVIAQMVEQYQERIIIVPGGGINPTNLEEVLECGVKEFHGTAREILHSSMVFRKEGISMGAIPGNEFITKGTSIDIVQKLVSIAKTVWIKNA